VPCCSEWDLGLRSGMFHDAEKQIPDE